MPRQNGKYRVYVYFNGCDVKGSPYIMRVGTKGRSGKTRNSPLHDSKIRSESPSMHYTTTTTSRHNDFRNAKKDMYEQENRSFSPQYVDGNDDLYKSSRYYSTKRESEVILKKKFVKMVKFSKTEPFVKEKQRITLNIIFVLFQMHSSSPLARSPLNITTQTRYETSTSNLTSPSHLSLSPTPRYATASPSNFESRYLISSPVEREHTFSPINIINHRVSSPSHIINHRVSSPSPSREVYKYTDRSSHYKTSNYVTSQDIRGSPFSSSQINTVNWGGRDSPVNIYIWAIPCAFYFYYFLYRFVHSPLC